MAQYSCLSLLMLLAHAALLCEGARMNALRRNVLITWSDLNVSRGQSGYSDAKDMVAGRVISVSKDGNGDSTTVQGAVDMVPDDNTVRFKILIKAGVYREKVLVPKTKPYISFIGTGDAVISYHLRASDRYTNGQSVGTYDSASVAVESDFFCATGITFEVQAVGSTYLFLVISSQHTFGGRIRRRRRNQGRKECRRWLCGCPGTKP